MTVYPIDIISASTSTTYAYSYDNSIINARNVDRIPPVEIALHSHPFCSILYVDDCDSFTSYIDGYAINFLPKHIYFLPPDTLHSPKNQFAGMFSSTSLKLYINSEALSDALGYQPFYVPCEDELNFLMDGVSEIAKRADISEANLLYELTGRVISELCSVRRISLITDSTDKYDPSFIKILKYMYAHCDRNINLEELAGIAHMERTAFAKKFKSLYKITPINYLYSIRLSRSLDFLMSPGIPITKIAKKIGFKRATAFSAAFTRAFGMTPTEYRDKLAVLKFPPPKKEFEI